MKKKIKIAVVGLGWVTLNRHVRAMETDPRYKIVGVIDRHPGRAERIAKKRKYEFFSETDDIDKVPWIDKVDAVTIGTAPTAHYSFIKAALKKGKHVLTEKPFCMTVEEGEEITELAKRQNLKLAIVHNFQFASSAKAMLNDIAKGRYGEIRSVTATQLSNPRRRLPAWYDSLPLGLFYDESPHLLYLISRIVPGDLSFIESSMFPDPAGKNTPAAMTVKYRAGKSGGRYIPVSVNMDFTSPISEWHLAVCGEKLFGDIDIFRDIYIAVPNDGIHDTWKVFRTSFISTWQHWRQYPSRGIRHLTGRLLYGNDRVFSLFASGILLGEKMSGIEADDGLTVLKMQHIIINNLKAAS